MPLKIFISYSHRDEGLHDELAKQLKPLEYEGLIDPWHDRKILPGDEFEQQISQEIESADIILLLVSPDFVSSAYSWQKEMTRAMARHEAGEARVIPVILRYADWYSSPFGKLSALPKDGLPVTKWSDRDEAFLSVAQGIRKIANQVTVQERNEVAQPDEAHRSPVKAAMEPGSLSEGFVAGTIQLADKGAVPVYSYAFSQDSGWALTGGRDKAIRLWDVKTGRCHRLFEGHTKAVESVAWSTDQRCALSAADDHTVRLWDVKTGRCLRVFEGHASEVWSVAWSHDQRYACSGSGDHSVRLWDVQKGTCVGVLEGHTDYVASVEWSPDQCSLVSSSEDGSVRLWDVETRQCLRVLEGHDCPVYCATWSPDQSRLLSGSDDGSVRLWDVETGQCLRALEGHTDYVVTVAWAANGRYALSGSEDTSVRLWDVETRQCLRIFESHAADVRCVTWSVDQHHAVSGDAKGGIRRWNLLEATGN